MQYQNLQELISKSRSSRQFFLSLPVPTQLMLHEQSTYIHTAADLHIHADAVLKHSHAVEISERLL